MQGTGGGALQALTQIIISDLIPLRERPLYNGLIGLSVYNYFPATKKLTFSRTWGVAFGVGPVVGGAFAQRGLWRWLFCELTSLHLLIVEY